MQKKTDINSSGPKPDDRGSGVSRRRLLKTGAPIAGALVLGAGSVGAVPGRQGAPGKGGEAIVPKSDYKPDKKFRVIGFTDDETRIPFQCEGQGRTISFPAWKFSYDGEDEVRKLYTRDNNVDTDNDTLYQWKPLESGAKDCGPAEGTDDQNLIQTPFITGK